MNHNLAHLDLRRLLFVCIGHRGACGYAPENTLAAFQKALDLGCPWVELDVYAVAGELLVIHDDSLERTTNGKGRVMDHDLAYLRGLDAGAGQQIPTLREVIERVDHRAGINVELKGPDTAIPASRLLLELLQQGWHSDEFLFSSFDHEELAKTNAAFRRGPLFHHKSADMLDKARTLNAFSLHLNMKITHQALVEAAHREGLKVYVYTVNTAKDITKMIQMGVDGVFTNYPDRVFSALAD